jgi:hypothetical protein
MEQPGQSLAPLSPDEQLRSLALDLARERQRRKLDRQDARARNPRRTADVAQVPSVDAQLYANIGRYAGSVVMTVFEEVGGVEAMADWAEENPGDFYTKLLPKVITAPRQIEVGGTITLEEAVKALDLEEGTDYHVVQSEPAADPSQF